MFKIALCDDNEVSLEVLKELIKDYVADNQLMAAIVEYTTPGELLMDRRTFDVYLLDMIMPGDMNGIGLGRAVRAEDPNACIVYVSSDSYFAAETYELNALSYLQKPVSRESLYKTLDLVRQKIKQENCFIQTPYGERRIPLNDILYVNIDKRCLCYHMRSGELIDGQTMRNSFVKAINPNLLENPSFCLVGTSLLVNVGEVKSLYTDHLIFATDEKLYFPRAHHDKIDAAWKSLG